MKTKTIMMVSSLIIPWLLLSGCGEKGGSAAGSAEQGTKYTCSMHPQVKQDGPGSCPICGMDLTPVKQSQPSEQNKPKPVLDEDGHAAHTISDDAFTSTTQAGNAIHLEAAKDAVLSARTVAARPETLLKSVQLFGEIQAIRDREVNFSWYYGGRVEKVLIDFNTTEVTAEQPILQVYSEQAIADQEMYLRLLRERWLRTFYERKTLTAQLDAVAVRLKLAGMTEADLDALMQKKVVRSTFTLSAPVAGSRLGELPRVGHSFQASDMLYQVVPLQEVWFTAKVFEKDMAYIKIGQRLRVETKARQGNSRIGEVVYIGRSLDAMTRTVEVRCLLPNPELDLLPNLSAIGSLKASLGEVAVAVPTGAVIETGTRQVIYVSAGKGHYVQRTVETGVRTEDFIQVLSGVEVGEQVVVEGAFLIDAEAQLRGTSGGHNH
jgi:RND family efflux transporter MFP subunit